MIILVSAIIVLLFAALLVWYGFIEESKWFKLIGGLLILISVVVGSYSLTTEGFQKKWKHVVSDNTGLSRIVVQYDYSGNEINRYEGNLMVEELNNGVSFIDNNGKEIKLIGGIIEVKEK